MLTPASQRSADLQPLKIGNIDIDFPVVQAALSGYSDWPMRVIAKRNGAPYTICEVMLDKFLVEMKERKRTSHFLHISDEEHPVAGQLMGAEPDQFALGARKLVEAGFEEVKPVSGETVVDTVEVISATRITYDYSQRRITDRRPLED